MKTKIHKPKLGDYFYYPDKSDRAYSGVSLRYKINFIGNNTFEFGTIHKGRFGWGCISELVPNPDKKSRVRWIFLPGINSLKERCYI